MSERLNLARYCIEGAARDRPTRTALCFAEQIPEDSTGPQLSVREFSFAEVEARVLQIAVALRELDARPGDRFLVRLRHSPEFAFAFFGAIAAGLIAVPVSPRLTAAEVDFLIADAEPAFICSDPTLPLPKRTAGPSNSQPGARWLELKDLTAGDLRMGPQQGNDAKSWSPTGPEDPAFLVYTSGTTGRPKGVLHAQRSVVGRRPMLAGWSGLGPDDRLLHAGQLNWTYSLGVGLMDPWSVGAAGLLFRAESSQPGVWPLLIRELGATIFAAVPSLYRRILKYAPADALRELSTLRYGLTAGEALAPELHAAWRDATGGKELYEALGMSEISTYISSGPLTPTRPGSPGKAQPGRTIAILREESHTPELCAPGEAGLLAVRRDDPGLMLGYWRRPDEESLVYRGEWFIGGDRAAIDEADGYVRYLGRRDEVMNASGYRVSPLEVEQALAMHPLVAEIATCETSPAPGVRIITAFVVPTDSALVTERHGGERIKAAERDLLAFAARQLAAYKRPRSVVFRDALPRTANGKLIRQQLS